MAAWYLGESKSGRMYVYEKGSDQPFKPNVYLPKNHTKEMLARAQLIAAAPELYSMLKYALKCIEYCSTCHKDVQSGDGIPIEILIKDVIAKADGCK